MLEKKPLLQEKGKPKTGPYTSFHCLSSQIGFYLLFPKAKGERFP
jgi:hypothetical protein